MDPAETRRALELLARADICLNYDLLIHRTDTVNGAGFRGGLRPRGSGESESKLVSESLRLSPL